MAFALKSFFLRGLARLVSRSLIPGYREGRGISPGQRAAALRNWRFLTELVWRGHSCPRSCAVRTLLSAIFCCGAPSSCHVADKACPERSRREYPSPQNFDGFDPLSDVPLELKTRRTALRTLYAAAPVQHTVGKNR